MKKNILKFYFFIACLGLALGCFLLNNDNVFALSANYDKNNDSSLIIAEWNNLKNDFLAKTGGEDGVMGGNLNVATYNIAGVANSTDPSDVVNKSVMDNIVTSSTGGVTFVNWGRNDCPSGSQELYEGFAFGTSRRDGAGSSNSVCIQNGSVGSAKGGSAGQMFPLVSTYLPEFLPSEIPISAFIRCAVCYNPGSTCYIKYGDENCEVNGYSSAYQGYALGALRSFSSHITSRKRLCINKSFDSTVVPASTPGSSEARLYGSRVDDNYGLTDYSSKLFVRCAVCCN